MKRLMIANRGEIAIRIARTAREMGLSSIAIHSEDDAGSLHVARADEAVRIPGKGARAYLDIEAVARAAKECGADAVHPGYGFLSENAVFAETLEAAGIAFIGPTPDTLNLFGDKSRARSAAREAGVPVPEGIEGPIGLADAKAFLKSLPKGRAIILKAVSGGGGRGVRIIRKASELEEAFDRAGSEARASFGDDSLYAEEFIPAARHIEVQIIGDGTGAVSHLHERECTLQRRHQKLLEMAPSPSLSESLRREIHGAAVAIGEVAAYRGLATMEFLAVPEEERFCFIEANARLQVEHTVTEEVLGLDLVRAQIDAVRGERLSDLGLRQPDVPAPNGFAIQARINLETLSPEGEVRPGGGQLTGFAPPTGPGLRTDTYGQPGYTTSPHFDSLIAKLIAHVPGGTYGDALSRLRRGLDEFVLEGAPSNLSFLKAMVDAPEVRANTVHTRFIDENMAALASTGAQLAAPSTDPARPVRERPASTDPLAVLEHGRGGQEPSGDDSPILAPPDETLPDGVAAVDAPLQGTLVKFELEPGDPVWIGRTVAIMEAMKMEHEVRARVSGHVRGFAIAPGETVREGHPLVYLDAGEVAAGDDGGAEIHDLDHVRPDLAEALARKAAGLDENRPEAVARRHKRGHRTARENIADLCDPGSFMEYGSFTLAAQRRRRSMEDLIANTSGDGMVCGLGHVNGHLFGEDRSRVMAMSYDYMVLAGTQGALNHYKKDRMFEIAERQRLPVVLYAEGGGGRPGDTDVTGVAGLDCHAFAYFAELSGLVPTIGIVNGRCFAGNAVLLGCCDVIIATQSANIGIGGPAMIEGGGLGVYRPEEVGPIDVQSANGVVDIAVEDEAQATAAAKQYLSYFQGPVDDWEAPDPRELRFAVPENRLRWYDMRQVIDGISDTGSVLELRRGWAPGIITAFIRVEGRPLGIIANDPSHLSGAIDSPGADKGARFLQLCDAYDIPVLSLVDCPGIMVGPEIEKTALVRHASRMMVVGANITTPLMGIVIRKGYGLGAQAMVGGSFRSPLFMVSWPTGEFGGMGLEGAVKLGYRKELEAIEDPEERLKTYNDMVARMYERGKAVNMASHFEIDEVIDPADTRAWIIAGLSSLAPQPVRTAKKRPCVDAW
ncbi:MAG: ATP-grasp domain-containing protein [Alphaproteobacteria bacterium]|jgi:acetyl/propionyl-CoA carboxylase alpha subunit|nr:ATP-grasp domain-containing protein [Alphaproteobacteria bacterium]